MPALLTASGMSLEQQTVRLHDSVDPFDVHCRTAQFAALTPEQRMDAPVTVGRLTGDPRLDLVDKLCLGLWATTSPLPGPLRCRLHGQMGTRHAERIGDRLHGVPFRAGEDDRNSRFFGCAISSAPRRPCPVF